MSYLNGKMKSMMGNKPGSQPTEVDLWAVEMGRKTPDSTLIARSDGVAIWHTEKRASRDLPRWRPVFGVDVRGLYRGFHLEQLHDVLERGLDVPAHSAFFASYYADKAWEYPMGREFAAMLVLDLDQAERSFTVKPPQADDSWQPDRTRYPHSYMHGNTHVHTRFEPGRGSNHYDYESHYGFWVPGKARDALIAIVLGGPRATVEVVLEGLQGSGSYGLELVS